MQIIPIFIPHRGCPHQCSFCNQNSITGASNESSNFVSETIDTWLKRYKSTSSTKQVAFYGGSFTCLPQHEQEQFLSEVQPYIKAKLVSSIRVSTRPDCIDNRVCQFLVQHHVTTVELGVQSLNDHVLTSAKRGHTAEDCKMAVRCLQKHNIATGIQLMVGLPNDTTLTFLKTLKETIQLAPSCVRIYPVLIIANSELSSMYAKKTYTPLSLNKAIALSSKAFILFKNANIKVIRIGLQPSTSLEKDLIAGPYHPSFGEMVKSRIWFNKVRPLLAESPPNERVAITISNKELSSFNGQKRSNIERLKQLGLYHKLDLKITTTPNT